MRNNSIRVALLRLVATAGGIVLIMLVILGIFSRSHFASFSRMFSGEVIGDILLRLPQTAELIAVSFVVASIAGLLCVLPHPRVLKPLITSIALVLECIPFFWLATALVFALSRVGMYPMMGSGEANLAGHLSRLFAPALVLTIFQFPLVVGHLNKRPPLGSNLRALARSIFSGLGVQFARDLPEVLTATVITELIFGWPGDGRLFWYFLRYESASSVAGLLLFAALSVLVIRFLAETFRGTKEAADKLA
jgi:peptide/nickel transport system permease protein